jgi:DNA-binding response OmpR family regulator
LTQHIAIVDDDPLLRERLAAYLRREGFRVTAVGGAAAMREVVGRLRIDLAIVDLAMPGEDGLSLTRALRSQAGLGIIILTGKSHPEDRALGLEVGADDYIAKPFYLRELLARVRSVLRRTQIGATAAPAPAPSTIRFAGWRLDLGARTLTSPRGHAVHLTTAEFQLLASFVDQSEQARQPAAPQDRGGSEAPPADPLGARPRLRVHGADRARVMTATD